jgi:FtsH-binding integral membrane protein
MTLGITLTGSVMFCCSRVLALQLFLISPGGSFLLTVASLGLIFAMHWRAKSASVLAAQALFWSFSAVMGMSLSYLLLMYTTVSLVQTFFATAASFGALAVYGYTTQKDLMRWGPFLLAGLFGMIVSGIVNMFVGSPAFHLGISAIGIVIFLGLTAYNMQSIKNQYYHVQHSGDLQEKSAILGALSLYLNFINLFISLLNFMGEKR